MSLSTENRTANAAVIDRFRASGVKLDSTAIIKRGSSAVLFRGSYTEDGQEIPAAIKVAKSTYPHALQNEIAPNIVLKGQEGMVKFIGSYVVETRNGPRQAFVMKYMPEGTLEDLLRLGPLTPTEAVRVTTQAADALSPVHEAGLVHKDVKPGNFMMDGGTVRLGDFGITKAYTDKGERHEVAGGVIYIARELSEHGVTAEGTLRYMAPEQVWGESNQQTDVRALSAMTFEMLTGEPLLDKPTEEEQKAVVVQPAAYREEVFFKAGDRLEELKLGAFIVPIMRSLYFDPESRHKDPENRPHKDAGEFARDLAARLAESQESRGERVKRRIYPFNPPQSSRTEKQ